VYTVGKWLKKRKKHGGSLFVIKEWREKCVYEDVWKPGISRMGWRSDVKIDPTGRGLVPCWSRVDGSLHLCGPCPGSCGYVQIRTGISVQSVWNSWRTNCDLMVFRLFGLRGSASNHTHPSALSSSLGRSAPYFRQAAARRKIVQIAVLHDPS
jgi:hypothetical protein